MSTAIADSHLSNADLAPTSPARRTWGTYNLAALWIGLSAVAYLGLSAARVGVREPATVE